MMEVKLIVMDELSDIYRDCEFMVIRTYSGVYWCSRKKQSILNLYSSILSRPSWCPLVVEDECVWVFDYRIDNAMRDIAPSCCVGEFSMNKPKYDHCPNCGKRIKYEEE